MSLRRAIQGTNAKGHRGRGKKTLSDNAIPSLEETPISAPGSERATVAGQCGPVPPSCAGDGATQRAGSAGSGAAARHDVLSAHQQPALSPAPGDRTKIQNRKCRISREEWGWTVSYRVCRSDTSSRARADARL